MNKSAQLLPIDFISTPKKRKMLLIICRIASIIFWEFLYCCKFCKGYCNY